MPHALVGQTLEVMHKGQWVALHPRHGKGRFSTMPKSHQAHRDWSPGRFLHWAEDIGPRTREVVQGQLNDRPPPEHGYRACLSLLQLSRRYSRTRLDSACARARAIRTSSYHSISSILKQGLDRQPLTDDDTRDLPELPAHANVRGPHYYH